MRRRFRDAHVARNDCLVDLLAEEAAHLGRHFVGELGAAVMHGQHHAVNFERWVQARPHEVDGFLELGNPFEREELALHGNQRRIGRRQRVQRQNAERRRAIDENVAEPLVRRAGRCSDARNELIASRRK